MRNSQHKNPLKVLAVAFACDPKAESGLGGGEDILGWNMVQQLSKFAEVWVLSSLKNKINVEAFLKEHKTENLHFFYIDFPRWIRPLWSYWAANQMLYYFWQIKAYFFAAALHQKNNFDVFHHITYANDWMASYIGALLPIPYIRGPGGGAHRIPKSFLKEYPFRDYVSQRVRVAGQWLFRHDPFFIIGQSKAKMLLVCNQESFDALPKKWQNKATFFPVNGISKEDLKSVTLSNTVKKGFLVVTVGRLLRIKGFDLAIKAFNIFSEAHPDARLDIIGEGPELKKLNALVTVGLEKKIVFTGWMPREAVLQKMSASDVFLFTSLRDGGGAVIVEAMAAAKPVICFDIAGPGFHIQPNYGIKIKPSSPNQAVRDIAQALEDLYAHRELRESMGIAARKKVEDFYLWDTLGDRLHMIYKDMLSEEE